MFEKTKLKIKKKFVKFAESVIPALTLGGDPEDPTFRRITDRNVKDLISFEHEKMLRIAYYLATRNLMAKRILEIQRDFVLGDGIVFTAEDENVKAVLDDFWNDPVNLLDIKQYNKVNELAMYGEQFYPVFVDEMTGKVTLGNIDPLQVKQVVTNKDNVEIIEEIVLMPDNPSDEDVKLKVINFDKKTGKLEGEVFFFKINSVSNGARGISDLFAGSEWIDLYDQFMFNRLERTAFMNAFLWDVTMQGFTPAQCIEEAQRLNKMPPKPGSIRVHNEGSKWEAVTPDLKASDADTDSRLIKNFILGGYGFPEHWFAEGGNVNRATASEMGEPTIKRLKVRQRLHKYHLEFMFNFVIDKAIEAGTLNSQVDRTFTVIMPELVAKDTGTAAKTLFDTVNATSLAMLNATLSRETSVSMVANAATRMGEEIVAEEEIKRIDNETNQDEIKDIEPMNLDGDTDENKNNPKVRKINDRTF
jgi:hypothetical protein